MPASANMLNSLPSLPPAHQASLDSYLRLYGCGCMAYSTLQPGLDYFIEEGVGYIAYLRFHHPVLAAAGLRIVLADPIADLRFHERMIARFLADPMPAIFLQASEAFAAILASHVADVFPCGVETELYLDRFDLRGGKKAHLRRWVNKAVAEKVRIAEAPIDEIPAEEVLAVSGEWLRRKGGREVRLLARPLCLEREEGVRCFWAWIGDRLVGMVIFDPMYEQQRVTGYYQNFIRMVKNAPHGVSDLATIHAIERFRSEGVFRLSLGLSPLGGIGAAAGARSPALAWVLTRMHRTSWLYGFQANLFHKRKYDGVERPVYVASSRKSSIRALLGVLKALDVV